jgi:cardiolipin synthase
VTAIAVVLVFNLTRGEKKVTPRIGHLYSIRDAQFQRTMGVLLGPVILPGNRFEELVNGDAIFPPMLAAIRGARRTITFETYIYWSGQIGKDFADALAERARAGVKVHVLLDWLGSNKMEKGLPRARWNGPGVEVRKFHEPRWYNIDKLNNRTHRKLLVVDGAIGFTGGVGIASEWTGNAQDADHWRDTHFKAEGPVIAQMQAVFADNWLKATGALLHGSDYFPALRSSRRWSGADLLELAFRRQRQHGAHVPAHHLCGRAFDRSVERVLRAGRGLARRARRCRETGRSGPHHHAGSHQRRGNGTTSVSCVVGRAARGRRGDPRVSADDVPLQGVDRRRRHGFGGLDELRQSVVSTERRGKPQNLRRAVRARQVDVFERDFSRSVPLTFEQWRSRPLAEKAWEHLAALLGPQL